MKDYDKNIINYGTPVKVTKDCITDLRISAELRTVITTVTFMGTVVHYDPELYKYTVKRINNVLGDGWYCTLEYAYADQISINGPIRGSYGPEIKNEDARLYYNDGYADFFDVNK